jgi:flotillin
MRKLAEVIATSQEGARRDRGRKRGQVRRAGRGKPPKRLEIDLEERRAEIAQTQEIESLMAAQLAEVARRKAEAELAAAQARIDMEDRRSRPPTSPAKRRSARPRSFRPRALESPSRIA